VVALRDGQLAGFMTGLVIPDFLGKRCAYCPEWANAAAGSDARMLYEEMYTRMCATWVGDGCRLHAVSVMAAPPEGLTALQASGFGVVSVDAVRDLTLVESHGSPVKIRTAAMTDVGTILKLGEELARHSAASPIFWPHEEPDYTLWLRQRGNTMLMALDRNRCLGLLGLVPGAPDSSLILRDDRTASIAMAITTERSRGTGIGTALLNQALQWAAASGYERCTVGFRMANYPAARFFLKRFRPAVYSLLRWIPEGK